MHIKRIHLNEADVVVHLFDKYRVFYGKESDPELARRFLTERLAENESVIFAAFETIEGIDLAVGFTQLYPTYSSVRTSKNWILNDLYVEKEFRKQGVGEKLIRTVMEFAKDTGGTYVDLSTATDNHTAQQLYETIGFKRKEPDTQFIDYRINI